MPYNTRRKSLSLPSLGIQLPHGSRAHRSNSKSTPAAETLPPPTKRVKRSHDDDAVVAPSPPASKPPSPRLPGLGIRPKSRRGGAENTPPPSPGDAQLIPQIDTQGINDDIVIAVIEQLEKTGNRPHLIRELATVLAATNDSVAQYVSSNHAPTTLTNAGILLLSSANPAALLSSRLSLYLKRPWTALAPCPLAKELIPVHPRKVYFFLTNSPRQALPANSDDIISPTVADVKRLTPSVSDPSVDQDDIDVDMVERARMSPSPEIDLTSPHLEELHLPTGPPTPGESFNGRSSLARDGTMDHRMSSNRAPSPPLEADEKGFTETATAVRERGMSLHESTVHESVEARADEVDIDAGVEDTPEMMHRKDQELGYELFGHAHSGQIGLTSSPMVQPRNGPAPAATRKSNLAVQQEDVEMEETSWDLDSPENVALDELDGMFLGF
jgi:hypothetical protein